MKEKINKTNVARLLDKAKVAYELVPYEVDENDLSATHVAEQLGENIEQVFKTLVLRGDKSGYFVPCVYTALYAVRCGNSGSKKGTAFEKHGVVGCCRTDGICMVRCGNSI